MEKVRVKILGLSCGHRKGRNTAWLVQYALKAAEKFGRLITEVADMETEFIDLADKDSADVTQTAQELYREILAVASGKQTKAEIINYGNFPNILTIGPVM